MCNVTVQSLVTAVTDLKEFQRFEQHVSFSDEGPLLETLEFFEISQGSNQALNFFTLFNIAHAVFYS